MSTDIFVLRDRLEELRKAYASAVQEYTFKDGSGVERRVTYKTNAEMEAAIKDLEDQIDARMNGKVTPPNFIKIRGTKGAI